MRGCAAESPLGNKELNEDEAHWHSNARSGGLVYRMSKARNRDGRKETFDLDPKRLVWRWQIKAVVGFFIAWWGIE
jgi:hypothetical protein